MEAKIYSTSVTETNLCDFCFHGMHLQNGGHKYRNIRIHVCVYMYIYIYGVCMESGQFEQLVVCNQKMSCLNFYFLSKFSRFDGVLVVDVFSENVKM